MSLMQLILVEADQRAQLADLVKLADEMMEDPRCQVVFPATHGEAGVIVSVWPDGVADEVEAGLIGGGWRIRRMQIVD